MASPQAPVKAGSSVYDSCNDVLKIDLQMCVKHISGIEEYWLSLLLYRGTLALTETLTQKPLLKGKCGQLGHNWN